MFSGVWIVLEMQGGGGDGVLRPSCERVPLLRAPAEGAVVYFPLCL